MGKTITTHLLAGTPKGIQSIQLSNRTLFAYIIPRSEFKKCDDFTELQTPCMYILFGEDDERNDKAYVGETDNFLTRGQSHIQDKEFWQKAFVFTTMGNTLNKADIMYLEYLAIKTAKEIKKYDLSENKQIPKEPTLQRHAIDIMNDFFDDVRFVTEFGGYNIFKSDNNRENKHEIFYIKGRQSEAKGFYNENGFTVLKGSIIDPTSVKSLNWAEKRNLLIKESTETMGVQTKLIKDLTFESPSGAGSFCTGSPCSGWQYWKNKNNKTLDEVFRK